MWEQKRRPCAVVMVIGLELERFSKFIGLSHDPIHRQAFRTTCIRCDKHKLSLNMADSVGYAASTRD